MFIISDIWERQKFNDKLEPIKAFNYFTEYLLMDKPRSLDELCKKLGKRSGYTRQLEKYSSKYNWQKRVEKYDEYICAKKRENKEKLYDEVIESELPMLKNRLTYLNKNFGDIEKDETIKPNTRAHAYDSNSKAYKNTMESLLTMVGKPKEYTDNRHEVESESTVHVSDNKSVFEMIEEARLNLGDIDGPSGKSEYKGDSR